MKSILAFILLISVLFLNAQTKQDITVGVGPSFFGWGDLLGVTLTATYQYQFNDHFGVEPRLISSSAWRYENNPYGSAGSGYNFDQTGYFGMAASFVYTPFKGAGSFLKLKSGFLAGKMAHSYGGMSNGIPQTNYVDFGTETLFGLIHTVNLRILNRKKFFVGTELSMLTSFSDGAYNCDGFVWNFMGGIKF
jgi:hypothetical protein